MLLDGLKYKKLKFAVLPSQARTKHHRSWYLMSRPCPCPLPRPGPALIRFPPPQTTGHACTHCAAPAARGFPRRAHRALRQGMPCCPMLLSPSPPPPSPWSYHINQPCTPPPSSCVRVPYQPTRAHVHPRAWDDASSASIALLCPDLHTKTDRPTDERTVLEMNGTGPGDSRRDARLFPRRRRAPDRAHEPHERRRRRRRGAAPGVLMAGDERGVYVAGGDCAYGPCLVLRPLPYAFETLDRQTGSGAEQGWSRAIQRGGRDVGGGSM